jgi:hypothetical protein
MDYRLGVQSMEGIILEKYHKLRETYKTMRSRKWRKDDGLIPHHLKLVCDGLNKRISYRIIYHFSIGPPGRVLVWIQS